MKPHPSKRRGLGLGIKTFTGKSGKTYLVFETTKGSFHVFAETEAKQAADDCGAGKGTTRERWVSLWRPKAHTPVVGPAPKTIPFIERLRAMTEKNPRTI